MYIVSVFLPLNLGRGPSTIGGSATLSLPTWLILGLIMSSCLEEATVKAQQAESREVRLSLKVPFK